MGVGVECHKPSQSEERTKKHPSFYPQKLLRAAGVGGGACRPWSPLRGYEGKCERETGSSGPDLEREE